MKLNGSYKDRNFTRISKALLSKEDYVLENFYYRGQILNQKFYYYYLAVNILTIHPKIQITLCGRFYRTCVSNSQSGSSHRSKERLLA